MPPKKPQEHKHLAELRKRVAKAPTSPGIYKWLTKKGDVLYIGKAKNLRSRLKSYLQKPDKSLGPWKLMMLKQIADYDVTVTNTELEALVLETNLIKESKPKYNVLMKDDKSYLYVQISKDPYPIIEIVRRGNAPNTIGFGPFTGAVDIYKTMDMLHTVFPYKACKKSLEKLNRAIEKGKDPKKVFTENSTPCMEYQIGECNGICVGKVSQAQYYESIKNIESFLRGNRTPAIEALQKKMITSAAEKKFERAAQYRNALHAIENMEERQLVSDASGEDMDIIGIAVVNLKAHVVLFRQRNGKVIDELNFTLAGEAETKSQALAQFLPQYYSESPDIPSTIVVGEELDEEKLLEEWLKEKRGKNVEIRAARRGKKSQLLRLAEKNTQEKIRQMETKWETAAKNTEQALEGLKDALALAEKPKRIECYDISHLGGAETVGSMVVAVNGKAVNDQYRSFTIRTLKPGEVDDYKALSEVLRRRLLYLVRDVKEEEKKWKEEGATFGKAREAEAETLEEIIKKDSTLSFLDVDHKDFLVARKENKIIACARVYKRKDGINELMSVWVHPDFRGQKLGQFLCKKLLSKEKKKVYAGCRAALSEYYGEIGFQPIRSAPKKLAEETAALEARLKEPHVVVMFDPRQNKPDSSLTAHPDLLVIDGGKGQVSTAVSVLRELELQIPVIGLAKREEEIFIPGASHPAPFEKDSQAKFLLMRLRNEAHRFANSLREKKGKKAAVRSALDDVPGIGEKTKQELLKRFGSVEGVRRAPEGELLSVLTDRQLTALRQILWSPTD